jgi:hypothetical protein
MKFLVRVTILFVVFVKFSVELKFGLNILSNNIFNETNPGLTEECYKALSDKKIKNQFESCIVDNCLRYDCDSDDFSDRIEDFCKTIWTDYCCGTRIYAQLCSEEDKKLFENTIRKDVKEIEILFCSEWPRKLFSCIESDNINSNN